MKKIFFIFISILFSVNVFGYSMSIKGMSHTKKFEKCKLTRYWDGNGYTIGWGHHLLKGESYKNISQFKADELFRKDIIKTNASINRLLKKFDGKVKFSQGFINGLGDLIYNCGEGGVKNSTFYKRLLKCRISNGKFNKSDIAFALVAVKTCRVSAKGHVERRLQTYKMMKG